MALKEQLLTLVAFFYHFTLLFGKEYGCTWSHKNSSFDLCPLMLTNSSQNTLYQVFDERSIAGVVNFTYYFNVDADIVSKIDDPICYNATEREKRGFPLGFCKNVNNYTCVDEDIVPINITTAAYQLHKFGSKQANTCYRLHDGITAPIWSLINEEDASEGVQITYTNGDWCQVIDEGGGRNREFTIQFICADDSENTFDKEEILQETEICHYELKLNTLYGCPLECPYVDYTLCGGNGICEYDYTNDEPSCFCYYGNYGSECTDTEDPYETFIYEDDDEKYVGGLIFVVILLFVMISILFYLWLRLFNVKKNVFKTEAVKKIVSKRAKKKQIKQGRVEIREDSYDDDERVAV